MDVNAYLIAGAVLASGPGGEAANSSTGYNGKKSTHFSEESQKRRKKAFLQERRAIHASLVTILASMATGEHGVKAKKVGQDWLETVKKCPGNVRRHGPCGNLDYIPHSCHFSLCPHCQWRRSRMWRGSLEDLISNAGLLEPKLHTFTVPNLRKLTNSGVRAISKAYTELRRLKCYSGVKGGARTIETTYTDRGGWHLHIHALVDSPWIAHYPQWDIERKCGSWKVTKKHPGLARSWAQVCQNYPELQSPRPDFDVDNPDHWYFVDMRVADDGAVAEIVKYITKQSDVLMGGPGAVLAFVEAFKGVHLIQVFGSLYGLDVDSKAGTVDTLGNVTNEFEERPMVGCCPWPDCPDRAKVEWKFLSYGLPDDVDLEFSEETGSYMVVESG